MKTLIKFWGKIILLLSLTILIFSSTAYSQVMGDYCITPPFIVAGVKPNLLMLIDNSASMFDLAYLDKGSATREPMYCNDQTYDYSSRYAGYFKDWYHYYEYDFTNGYFTEVSAPVWTSCDKYVAGTLCINGINLDNTSTPKTVTKFVAEGNYLNWLTSSKFDIQKSILTGGKYLDKICSSSTDITTLSCATDADCPSGDTCIDVENFTKLETRGCVGRRFIKLPLLEHNQQWNENGTHTPLGLTFAIRGPNHPYSETLLSPGGQTYLEIYAGTYDLEGACADAVEAIIDGEHKNVITGYLEECLNYSSQGQAKYCSLDFNTQCDDDSDCAGTPGICDVVSDGICSSANDGICSLTTSGVCTADNGTCSASKFCVGGSNAGAACNNKNQCDSKVCSKICQGGGKDGATCSINSDCFYSSCTAGKVGNICSVNADCDLKTCTAGLVGNTCVANADCNTKVCTAGLIGNACIVDSNCNSGLGICTTGNVGAPCALDIECSIGYKGVCQKPVTSQIKTTFTQSVHECTQYWDSGSLVGNNWLPMITNPQGCNQMYKDIFTCRGGARDTKLCETNADCPGGECINGPEAIRPGSPVLICAPNYAGYCASSICSGGVNNGLSCSVPADCPGGKCWETTIWNPREYGSVDLCVKTKFEEYCAGAQEPPVTDPSDDPSSTEKFDNLPAIIGDMALGSQLGEPLIYQGCTSNCALALKLRSDTPPTGLIQEFQELINFGAMRFNYFGNSSECPANMSCEKICQNARSTCRVNADCPTGDVCVAATNLDGSRILDYGTTPGEPNHMEGYILGRCSSTITTTCNNPTDCPAGETCVYSVGNHSSGFIKALDDIFASTWTPFAEGFYNAIGYFSQRQDMRLNSPDFLLKTEDADVKDPIQYKCQKNNILFITDGMSTADLNSSVNTLISSYNDGDGQIDTVASTCPEYAGSRNLDDLAWLARHRNINDFTQIPALTDPAINSKTITTHVVFNGTASTDPGECNPDSLLSETAENGGGTYQRAEDPEQLKQALREAFLLIAGKAASGTAASVLATGEGSGANLVQAIFYPEITFPASNEVTWVGTLKNIWYYIDPFLGSSSIREDTSQDNTLSLTADDIVTFYFDTGTNTAMAHLYRDTDGDGDADAEDGSRGSPVYFENVRHLWEAGAKLWVRSADDRTIYTTADGSNRTDFTTANAASLRDLLRADSNEEAVNIISYVRGYDNKYCSTTGITCNLDADCTGEGARCLSPRNRTTKLDLNGDGDTADTVNGISEGVSRVYKLGDIVNSTPRIVSYVPLNNYYRTYQDNSYKEFYETTDYQNRGLVLVGANDGMLHAFRLGKIEMFEEKSKKATISGTDLGKEEWAFIPRSALPYLQHLRDDSYCHLYYTDLTPYVLDASICAEGACSGDYWDLNKDVNSWRTIVIGGLRLGGACKDPTDTGAPIGVADSCTKDINGDGAVTNEDCVLTPTSGIGYSSYFALDITDPTDPQVLWEFTNPNLGYATTGPAIVRIAGKTEASKSEPLENQIPDHNKNGRWFVVIGSGPTGPINTDTHQFYGHSDQNMRVFIIDLKDGSLVRTIDSGIQNAFAGSMVNAQADFDMDNLTANGFYQDDAVYFGFTKAENNPPVATTKWNSGGVMRLFTKNSLDPDDWELSKVIENIGPVTSAVTRLQNFITDDIWLFWGTGRYYFKIADNIDDSDARRSLYGLKEPCFDTSGIDFDCTTAVARSSLGDATSGASSDEDGWYINLDLCTDLDESGQPINVDCSATSTSGYKTERNVTDPLATPIGAVFFTTTKPAADVCTFGGASHLWVVDYDTGGAVSSSILRGKALLQVSTGSIEEITLESALTEKGGRRTPMIQGVPPTGAPPGILIPPEPVDKILHIREQ